LYEETDIEQGSENQGERDMSEFWFLREMGSNNVSFE
jgi:hypothetical protein